MKRYIISNPNILGGTPVITGTRIPVERILYLFKEGYTIDDIHDEYDYVDKKTLKYVIEELGQRLKGKLNGSPQTISL
ncbi:MAG: DUF433 domain-containing protein [Patescibacteria group bacterium]